VAAAGAWWLPHRGAGAATSAAETAPGALGFWTNHSDLYVASAQDRIKKRYTTIRGGDSTVVDSEYKKKLIHRLGKSANR